MTILIYSSGKDKKHRALYNSTSNYATISKSDVVVHDGTSVIDSSLVDITLVDVGRNTSIQITDSTHTISKNGLYNIVFTYSTAKYVQIVAFKEDIENIPGPDNLWKQEGQLTGIIKIDNTTVTEEYDAFSFGDDDLSCCGRCQL